MGRSRLTLIDVNTNSAGFAHLVNGKDGVIGVVSSQRCEKQGMRTRAWIPVLTAMAAALPAAAAADGLVVPPTVTGLSRWQTRLEVETFVVQPALGPSNLGASQVWQSARLFSDYHLDTLKFGQTSGLKLTSGLLLTQREAGWAFDSDGRTAWPYLGLGYSGASAHGDWGFNADVGMAAQSLGATVRLGRAFGGGLSMSDALRDLRLQPVVRLGVTYSF